MMQQSHFVSFTRAAIKKKTCGTIKCKGPTLPIEKKVVFIIRSRELPDPPGEKEMLFFCSTVKVSSFLNSLC